MRCLSNTTKNARPSVLVTTVSHRFWVTLEAADKVYNSKDKEVYEKSMTAVRVVLIMTLSMSKPSKLPILIASFMSLQTELCRALFYCAILRSHSENCLPQAFPVFSNILFPISQSDVKLSITVYYALYTSSSCCSCSTASSPSHSSSFESLLTSIVLLLDLTGIGCILHWFSTCLLHCFSLLKTLWQQSACRCRSTIMREHIRSCPPRSQYHKRALWLESCLACTK